MHKFQSPFRAGHVLIDSSFLRGSIEVLQGEDLINKQAFARRLLVDILFKNNDDRYYLALKKRVYKYHQNRSITHDTAYEILFKKQAYYSSVLPPPTTPLGYYRFAPKSALRILYRDGSVRSITAFLWLVYSSKTNFWFTFFSRPKILFNKYGVSIRASIVGFKELENLRIIEKINPNEPVSKKWERGVSYRWGKAIGVRNSVASKYLPRSLHVDTAY